MLEPLFEQPKHGAGWPSRLAVCGQYEARRDFSQLGVTHLISIKGPSMAYRGPAIEPARHLLLQFDDTHDRQHFAAPQMSDVEAVKAFVSALPQDACLMIHCLQGVSRSTAMALGLLAQEAPPFRACALLHRLRPQAMPNRLLVKYWDQTLGLDGELEYYAGLFPCRSWPVDAPKAGRSKAGRAHP